MEELTGFIANMGFPIAMSLFLLFRMESKIEGLENSIRDLTQALNQHK